jgi:hypothetical protein
MTHDSLHSHACGGEPGGGSFGEYDHGVVLLVAEASLSGPTSQIEAKHYLAFS